MLEILLKFDDGKPQNGMQIHHFASYSTQICYWDVKLHETGENMVGVDYFHGVYASSSNPWTKVTKIVQWGKMGWN